MKPASTQSPAHARSRRLYSQQPTGGNRPGGLLVRGGRTRSGPRGGGKEAPTHATTCTNLKTAMPGARSQIGKGSDCTRPFTRTVQDRQVCRDRMRTGRCQGWAENEEGCRWAGGGWTPTKGY